MNSEIKYFLILTVLLFVWFMFGLDYLSPWLYNNFLIAYTIFIITDTYLVSKYILFHNEKFDFSKWFALVLIFLATDIIMFPYLVSKSGLVTDVPIANMSSDVFIWTLLPSYIIPLFKYLIVYVIVPALLLIVARGLTTKRWFWQHVKSSV